MWLGATMLLADVVGTVVMTEKHPAFAGEKLLVVQPVDAGGSAIGSGFVAVDRAQAGVGDRVMVMREGNGVRQIVGRDKGLVVDQAIRVPWPVRSMIVGIVDKVDTTTGGAA